MLILDIIQISTYPRKGTETARSRACSRRRRFQLIPARGRKLVRCNFSVRLAVISTYPRKGTETPGYAAISTRPSFQLIPARGRKPIQSCKLSCFPDISTYPRKGAKNSASKKMRSFSFANLNSLFSVGFFSMNRAAAAFSLPWLLYCDKMCYNRANSKHLLQNTQTHFLFIVQFFHNL